MTSIKIGTFKAVSPAKNGLMTEQVVIQVRPADKVFPLGVSGRVIAATTGEVLVIDADQRFQKVCAIIDFRPEQVGDARTSDSHGPGRWEHGAQSAPAPPGIHNGRDDLTRKLDVDQARLPLPWRAHQIAVLAAGL